ncbi:hypothetical protein UU9_02384 [Rhodanobacter fulvus Jip2]|uniref:Uncharacterized protein n=1 Tax=Rhodanobacter fulvus Jip2 TaxID=1163408 RepID=I4VYG8_9GAMM|nr:hypothetical protein [Rhodanobacter fulvus]EIL92259.1 hypothetical protein UU9_02384 [Rhodanobacter fulvus Jip2]
MSNDRLRNDRPQNDRPQHHAQPGERGQGGDGLHADAVTTPAPQGGLGGLSGTGQATPHHGLQPPGGKAALNPPVGGSVPASGVGASYQVGGTRQDRAQKDAERKADEAGRSPADSRGAADPAPGSAPDSKGRNP